MKKIKIIEDGWPRYKLKISVTPMDKEIGRSKIVEKEYVFRSHKILDKFYQVIRMLDARLGVPSSLSESKVWIHNSSQDKNQFGFIVKKESAWNGYEIFFPNGLDCRNDPHYRSFHQEFITTDYSDRVSFKTLNEAMAARVYNESCHIGDVEPYMGTDKLHWEEIAFGPPQHFKK